MSPVRSPSWTVRSIAGAALLLLPAVVACSNSSANASPDSGTGIDAAAGDDSATDTDAASSGDSATDTDATAGDATNTDSASGDATNTDSASGDDSGSGGDSTSAEGGSDAAAASLSFLTVSPAAPALNVGATVDLQASGNFSDGVVVSPFDAQVTWTSSAPAIATVSSAGLVTGVAAGVATVTVAKGGIQTTARVEVTASTRALTGIALNPTSMSLAVGTKRDIAASALWSDGTGSSGFNGSVTWATSKPAVATVDNLGMVTSLAAGTAVITASAGGQSAQCTVTVVGSTITLTSLSMSPASGSIPVGGTLNVSPVGHYSDGSSGTVVPITTVALASTNPSVATVDVYGLITGKAAGTSTITGTLSGKSGSATITVVAAPSFDARLVGNWQWIGVPDPSGTNFGSFYHFYANGTFTYDLIYQVGAGACITTSKTVAHHEGTFSSAGSLDNPSSAGQLVFACTSHFTDYTDCSGATTRTSWTGSNPHFHWAAFSGGNLITNHSDDFNATGNLTHVRY